MKLYSIIENVNIKNTVGELDIEIENLNFDSRIKKKNALFFCIDGNEVDAHLFYKEAIENGAIAFVVEKILPINITQILVYDCREVMSRFSKNFYNCAADKLKIISIIGTNGKTTTSYLISSILKKMGKKVGVIGTCGIVLDSKVYENLLTTPDPITLHYIFNEMLKSGIEYVVIEVSAHAIYLKKMAGVLVEVAVFTNITQDHLDFFETMENYSLTKINYFDNVNAKMGIINVDDKYGKNIVDSGRLTTMTYGLNNPSDVFAINYNINLSGIDFVANINDYITSISLNLSGRFNIYNALAAAACCYSLGATIDEIKGGLESLKKVDGRFNVYPSKKGFYAVVDFAHTDDALLNLLKTVRECCNKKIILVFGCGGNRDRKKRPLMGAVADKFADEIIITTDNSRYEEQSVIAEGIILGIKTKPYICIDDRVKAIEYALGIARAGDAVVIAGKGQERYQEIMGKRLYFNDGEQVLELIKNIDINL